MEYLPDEIIDIIEKDINKDAMKELITEYNQELDNLVTKMRRLNIDKEKKCIIIELENRYSEKGIEEKEKISKEVREEIEKLKAEWVSKKLILDDLNKIAYNK